MILTILDTLCLVHVQYIKVSGVLSPVTNRMHRHNWQYCSSHGGLLPLNCSVRLATLSVEAQLLGDVATVPLTGHKELVAGFPLALLVSSLDFYRKRFDFTLLLSLNLSQLFWTVDKQYLMFSISWRNWKNSLVFISTNTFFSPFSVSGSKAKQCHRAIMFFCRSCYLT